MTPKRGLRLVLALICLSPAGCAGLGVQHRAPRQKQAAAEKPEEKDSLAELQRDLLLYAD